ncbi:MAG: TetR/AcrR family transcriptional regulator [Oscillospiraceae bacterium]|nr:TetR/AcrR family transcriptional regulator [Oscillospiraceae bacterium]
MLSDAFETIIEEDFAIAYLKLLGQMYYKQITVTMLVEAAGYGRATFYAYFSGLKELRQKLNAYDLAETKNIFETAMNITDEHERIEFMLERLIPHMKMFWPLICENNMPNHMEDMKVCVYDLFRDRFVERFKDTKFDDVIVESFCVSGMLHMIKKTFEVGDDVKNPPAIVSMIEFINHMLF